MFRRQLSTAGSAVLCLSREVAEWFDDSGKVARYGRATVEGEGGAALAAAADRARQESGGPRCPCVVTLGGGLIWHERIEAPPIGRKELTKVFTRKSAALLGVAREDTLFTALAPTSTDPAAPGRSGATWTVLAMRRAEATALRLRLRERGFSVRRVVSSRMAAVQAAQRLLSRPASAAMLVSIEPSTVTLTLFRGETILNQDRIEGDFLVNPSIATSLIHEVKSFLGYWKKESRGEVVEELVLLGLPSDRGTLLRHAFESALSGVTVIVRPDESEEETELAGRFEHFRAARAVGPLNPALTTPLAPRRATVAALALCCTVAACAVGWRIHGRLVAQEQELRVRAGLMGAEAADLTTVYDENRDAAERIERLRASVERVALIRASGVAAEEVVAATLDAFQGRASLLDLDVRAGIAPGELKVAITGLVGADPAEILVALGGVTRSLEGSGRFRDVVLTLPDVMPDARSGRNVEFQINALLES
ncbi:MAG: hypothetical protein AAF682_11130 [Planctomycetota bacterium]